MASLNRELQVLRRMFHLAQEWGRVERALPNVKMLPGEKHRERVLTAAEEDLYFKGASTEAMEQYATLPCFATLRPSCSIAACARRSASGCELRMWPMARSKSTTAKPIMPAAESP